MVVNQPHFLLFTDAHLSKSRACAISDQGFGRWHFVLERLDGPERLEAADSESDVHRDRLALLAVVRGLEALEQPSQVTLVTTSRYVSRGLRYGLNEWREAEYTWEHFGMQKPIRNADLWQRIDGAMRFHQVTCRLLQSPLAQAMVETATELDELTMITNPLDVPFEVSENLVSENQTAAALARRAPAGVIQRVDSAHGSVGTKVDAALRTGPALGHVAMAHRPVAGLPGMGLPDMGLPVAGPNFGMPDPASVQQAAILQAAANLVHKQTAGGRSPIVHPEAGLMADLPFAFRRPRISITLPTAPLRCLQLAKQWMQRWWARLASVYSRFSLQSTSRSSPRPAIAPT
jgi:ribonuclease HI